MCISRAPVSQLPLSNHLLSILKYSNTRYPDSFQRLCLKMAVDHFFRAANLFDNSSTSGIVPPTGPVLCVPLPATICIFFVGFRSNVPLTLGCKLSVLGLGGFTLNGEVGPKFLGGVALLNAYLSSIFLCALTRTRILRRDRR